MAYISGKTYLTKSQKAIREAIKKKDISIILWKIIEESFQDMEANVELRHGKDFMRFAIQQVAILEGKKGKTFSPEDHLDFNELAEWAGVSENKEEEDTE